EPYTITDSCQLVRAQRRFISCAAFTLKIKHLSHDYFIVIQDLGLISLADRRINTNFRCTQQIMAVTNNNPLDRMMRLVNESAVYHKCLRSATHIPHQLPPVMKSALVTTNLSATFVLGR
ncbi:Uncharacterized protein FWK35_00008768, partial [Aphis craccivora]